MVSRLSLVRMQNGRWEVVQALYHLEWADWSRRSNERAAPKAIYAGIVIASLPGGLEQQATELTGGLGGVTGLACPLGERRADMEQECARSCVMVGWWVQRIYPILGSRHEVEGGPV
jgi:hypothetical protein